MCVCVEGGRVEVKNCAVHMIYGLGSYLKQQDGVLNLRWVDTSIASILMDSGGIIIRLGTNNISLLACQVP